MRSGEESASLVLLAKHSNHHALAAGPHVSSRNSLCFQHPDLRYPNVSSLPIVPASFVRAGLWSTKTSDYCDLRERCPMTNTRIFEALFRTHHIVASLCFKSSSFGFPLHSRPQYGTSSLIMEMHPMCLGTRLESKRPELQQSCKG